MVGDAIQDELNRQIGPRGPSDRKNSVRLALADHFWCDPFVAIARLASDVRTDLDTLPERVTEVITDSRGGPK